MKLQALRRLQFIAAKIAAAISSVAVSLAAMAPIIIAVIVFAIIISAIMSVMSFLLFHTTIKEERSEANINCVLVQKSANESFETLMKAKEGGKIIYDLTDEQVENPEALHSFKTAYDSPLPEKPVDCSINDELEESEDKSGKWDEFGSKCTRMIQVLQNLASEIKLKKQ